MLLCCCDNPHLFNHGISGTNVHVAKHCMVHARDAYLLQMWKHCQGYPIREAFQTILPIISPIALYACAGLARADKNPWNSALLDNPPEFIWGSMSKSRWVRNGTLWPPALQSSYASCESWAVCQWDGKASHATWQPPWHIQECVKVTDSWIWCLFHGGPSTS